VDRRNFLNLAVGAGAAGVLAGCGSDGPKSSGSGTDTGGTAGAASYWFLTGAPGEKIRNDTVKRFNDANPTTKITPTAFANDAYKDKIKTAIGAGQAPTLIWGWGGGGLKSYVDGGQVEDLTSFFSENAALKDKLFESSFGAATVDGKIYAMPCETVAPIVLFYNKDAFAKVGIPEPTPTTTWAQVLEWVPKFNAKKIAPFSLAGQSRWTNMMWLEFLFDRIGGSEVFQAVFDGEKDAWSNPASIQALTAMQDLIKAKGFQDGFQSTVADANADQALLFTGKAAMMLHGTWTYGSMKNDGGDFVSSGKLGYTSFPLVDGGKGDPTDTVGNPGQYISISSKATPEAKEIAKNFFKTAILSDAEVKEWIESGSIPIVKTAESQLAGNPDEAFLKFVYAQASGAKVFAQSWDQALSPTAAETLLDNIAKLFQLSITPQQFATNMNAVIGK
jgi:raffinose/stachyose/melibiose transport system substrate-binding protein